MNHMKHMSVLGSEERSWRKARKRAVSPIIATILLVAITVVLAAVLYVLITGLTSGGASSVPIGTTFAYGTAQQTGSPPTATVCGAAAPTAGTCYAIGIQSAGSSATTANINFAVELAGTGKSFGTVSIVSTSGSILATYSSTGWVKVNAASLPVSFSSTETLILYSGSTTTSYSGLGYSLVAIGVGSLSGTTSVALP
jgi:archaeal type IV pilus assembly protein PilA